MCVTRQCYPAGSTPISFLEAALDKSTRRLQGLGQHETIRACASAALDNPSMHQRCQLGSTFFSYKCSVKLTRLGELRNTEHQETCTRSYMLRVKSHVPQTYQPAKTSVSPRSSPLGTFRVEERLRLSDRNSILMTQNLSGIWSEALIGRQSSYIVLAIVYE